MNNIIAPSILTNISPAGGVNNSAAKQAAGNGASFGELIRNSAQSALNVMEQSEKVSAQAITGDADLNDVVQAVTAAELTLQTTVAVRDRIVSALQEVLRMPI